MKRILIVRNSLNLVASTNGTLLMAWLEQVAAWVLTMGVDWTKLPWAFAAASIATYKAAKGEDGKPIHKPFWEWIVITLGGTIVAMASWKDVAQKVSLSPEFSTVIAGLIGWLLCDYILKTARKGAADGTLTPKP